MYKFSKFETEELVESLNTPVEFEITTDTRMPAQIYATFEINGSTYRMWNLYE